MSISLYMLWMQAIYFQADYLYEFIQSVNLLMLTCLLLHAILILCYILYNNICCYCVVIVEVIVKLIQ